MYKEFEEKTLSLLNSNLKNHEIMWFNNVILYFYNVFEMIPENIIVGKWKDLELKIKKRKKHLSTTPNEIYDLPLHITKKDNSIKDFQHYYQGGIINIPLCKFFASDLDIDKLIFISTIFSSWVRTKKILINNKQQNVIIVWLNSHCWEIKYKYFTRKISELLITILKNQRK